MILKKLILLIVLFVSISNLKGQNSKDSVKISKLNKEYFKSYYTDTKNLIISPLKWKKTQLIGFGLFASTSYFVYTKDLKINNFAQSNRNYNSNWAAKNILEPIGSGVYSMSGVALLGLQGVIFKNNRSVNTSLLCIKTYIITGLVVTIPKLIVNRHRPYNDNPSNPNIFAGPSLNLYESYPSGHTTSAFAIATIIASEYNDNLIIPISAYSIASLVGLSRINDNKHWASDVLGGAVFGWAMGKFLYKVNKKNIFISPFKSQDATGISMNIII